MTRLIHLFRSKILTIGIWSLIIIAIVAMVGSSQHRQRRFEDRLSSNSQATRDAVVREAMMNDTLMDDLTGTIDATGEPDSPLNKRSLALRESAAESVGRIVAGNEVPKLVAYKSVLELRKDGSPVVKGLATDTLTSLGRMSPADLNRLVNYLGSSDPDTRSAAVDALGNIGGDTAARSIDAKIKDVAFQDSACLALSKIGPAALPYINERATDRNVDFRLKMVDILGQIGQASSIPSLINAANDTAPSVRRLAIISITRIVQLNLNAPTGGIKVGITPREMALIQSAEPTLGRSVASSSDDSAARAEAAFALGRMQTASGVKTLIGALGDYDTSVASAAAVGLQLSGPTAVKPLIQILQTPAKIIIRSRAAQALGGIGDQTAVSVLEKIVRNPSTDPTIKRSALTGLGRTGSKLEIPLMVTALSDSDGTVASIASDSLLDSGVAADAVPALIMEFRHADPAPFNASRTLSRMGRLAIPQLKEATLDKSPEVQSWAAVTLGQIGSKDKSIVEVLTPLAHSSNSSVKYTATQAIAEIGQLQ
jgi:HEAT repeat protein